MTGRGSTFDSGWGRALLLLVGGAAGAAALTTLRVPAGALIGAVVGSALVNRARRSSVDAEGLPAPVRTVGLILLGCTAGVQLETTTLLTLAHVAVPLVASIVVLLLLDLALAVVLARRYEIDPLTAVLACAPGGVTEIAVTASRLGARLGPVLAIHTVRVLAVVLLVLPALVATLPST